MLETKHPVSLRLKDTLKPYLVKDVILYNNKHIKIPHNKLIKANIRKSPHDRKLAVHPGLVKTLSLTAFMNRYIDGFDLFQCFKSVTQKPFGTPKPLPVPAGPLTDISYNFITGIPA